MTWCAGWSLKTRWSLCANSCASLPQQNMGGAQEFTLKQREEIRRCFVCICFTNHQDEDKCCRDTVNCGVFVSQHLSVTGEHCWFSFCWFPMTRRNNHQIAKSIKWLFFFWLDVKHHSGLKQSINSDKNHQNASNEEVVFTHLWFQTSPLTSNSDWFQEGWRARGPELHRFQTNGEHRLSHWEWMNMSLPCLDLTNLWICFYLDCFRQVVKCDLSENVNHATRSSVRFFPHLWCKTCGVLGSWIVTIYRSHQL